MTPPIFHAGSPAGSSDNSVSADCNASARAFVSSPRFMASGPLSHLGLIGNDAPVLAVHDHVAAERPPAAAEHAPRRQVPAGGTDALADSVALALGHSIVNTIFEMPLPQTSPPRSIRCRLTPWPFSSSTVRAS